MLPSEYIQKGWCKLVLARDSRGVTNPAWGQNACQWCCLGALSAALQSGSITDRQDGLILSYIYDHLDTDDSVPAWNDRQETSEPIIAMLQAAEKEVLHDN